MDYIIISISVVIVAIITVITVVIIVFARERNPLVE